MQANIPAYPSIKLCHVGTGSQQNFKRMKYMYLQRIIMNSYYHILPHTLQLYLQDGTRPAWDSMP